MLASDLYEYSTQEILSLIGERYKYYRIGSKQTQREISEKTNISIMTIHNFESGKCTNMTLNSLILLLKAINYPDGLLTILPDIKYNGYLYTRQNKMKQRVKHKTRKK